MPRARFILAAAAAATLPTLALVAPATAAHTPKTPPKRVTYVVRGTLTADATATSASLDVTGENAKATAGLGKLSTITATIGPKTHITRRGTAKATFADLKSGDRVVVRWRVRPGTALAKLSAAGRITDRGAPTSMHATKTTKTTKTTAKTH